MHAQEFAIHGWLFKSTEKDVAWVSLSKVEAVCQFELHTCWFISTQFKATKDNQPV